MFVYNSMVHDARVRREARTLTAVGYGVTVVAVHEPGETVREEMVDGFRIVRLELRERRRGQPLTTGPAAGAAASTRTGAPRRASGRGLRARLFAVLEAVVRTAIYPLRRVLVFGRFVRAGLHTKAAVYHAHDLNTLLMAWTVSRIRREKRVSDRWTEG